MKYNLIVSTIVFYILYIGASSIANHYSPGGPCVPGLGGLMFLGLLPVSGILFLRSLFKYYINPERQRVYCIAIHFLVFAGFFILVKIV